MSLAHNILPEARHEALFEPHDPFATVFVGVVLPHGADSLAEDVIVANRWALVHGPAQVHVQPPEVLDGLCGAECKGVLLIRFVGHLLEVGERPRVGERVHIHRRRHGVARTADLGSSLSAAFLPPALRPFLAEMTSQRDDIAISCTLRPVLPGSGATIGSTRQALGRFRGSVITDLLNSSVETART